MAIKLADAVVYLTADDGPLGQTLNKAKSTVGGAVSGLGSIAKTALTGAVLGGATLAAGAIIGIGTAAFDVSNQTRQAAADMAASLGVPTEEAERFADVARDVYGNAFAGSVTEAGAAVAEVARQMKLAADDPALPALQTITENAFRLKDVFGVEVNDSISTVKTLMENFGLTSEQAFDLLAKGYQSGLDRSGDFLDTVNEYSTQFANGGASASEFFSLLESGLQGGVLGTDKAADAFKEFQVRILDGSQSTADSLAALGINSEEFTNKLSTGQMTVAEAFSIVTGKLAETSDQATLMQAGVGLLGTQFEDLGADAATALSMTEDWASGSEGAISSLDAKYSTFGSAVEAIWRRLVVSVSPFTDKLLDLVNNAMPTVMSAFDAFDKNVGPAVERAGQTINTVVGFVKGLFNNDLAPAVSSTQGVFGIFKAWIDENMPLIQQTVKTVISAIQTAWEVVGPIIETVVKTAFGNIKTTIETTLSVILGLVKAAMQLINGDFEGAGETLKRTVGTLWEGVKTIFTNNLNGIKEIVKGLKLDEAGRAILESLKSGINEKWEGLKSWFRDKLQGLRDMLPFSEPKDSSSPLRNLSKAGEGIREQIQKGLDESFRGDFLRPVAAAAGGAGGAMSISVVQNFYGPADEATVRRGSERGLRDALRQAGQAGGR